MYSLQQSIVKYGEVLKQDYQDVQALKGRGIAFGNLGNLVGEFQSPDDTEPLYRLGCSSLEGYLLLCPNDAATHRSLGTMFLSIRSSDDTVREHDLKSAVDHLESSANLDHCNAKTHLLLGVAQRQLGDCAVANGSVQDAIQWYSKADAAYFSALSISPESPDALEGQGMSLQKLGSALSDASRFDEAIMMYQKSARVFGACHQLNPEDDMTPYFQGSVLDMLGNLHVKLGKSKQATNAFMEAIEAYDRSSDLNPARREPRLASSFISEKLGDMFKENTQYTTASEYYVYAIDHYQYMLDCDPGDVEVVGYKATALAKLMDVLQTS